jgi:SAM-dependent methyltransferase
VQEGWKMLIIEQVKQYFRGVNPKDYCQDNPVRDAIIRYFSAYRSAKSVFEFGCNGGKNLALIKKRFKDVEVFGIDINNDAIAYGKTWFNLDLQLGDEHFLSSMENNSYDFVLTASVLDHIPPENIEVIVMDLKRISKMVLFCVESNEIPGIHCFKHDYPKLGFRYLKSVLNEKLYKYDMWFIDKLGAQPMEQLINEPI